MYKLPITVDLSHNKLKKLTPPKMKGPMIHKVDVSHNQLTHLPPNFNNLQCMTRLDLSNNQLEEISEQLGLTKYIRWLDLSHNALVELPETFCALGYAIDELRVTHNQLKTLPQNVDNFKVSGEFRGGPSRLRPPPFGRRTDAVIHSTPDNVTTALYYVASLSLQTRKTWYSEYLK